MDKIKLSILQQKAHGTFKRNELIRQMKRQGENMAEIGRQFRLSRQQVRIIVSEGSEHE